MAIFPGTLGVYAALFWLTCLLGTQAVPRMANALVWRNTSHMRLQKL